MIIRIVTFEGLNTKKDGSLSVRFSTLEQTPEQSAELMSLRNKVCVLALKPDSEKMLQQEVDKFDEIDVDVMDKPKTQSQRLRGVLYINWTENPKGFSEFKDYYKHETERIIQHYKDKLD